MCVCVCVCMRERERETLGSKSIQEQENVLTKKGGRYKNDLTNLQGERRVLYIVTLSLH